MSGMKLLCAAPELIWEAWPMAAPFIERSYGRNDQKVPNGLLDDLRAGRKLLWIAADDDGVAGAIVTAIYELGSGKVCRMHECGGDRMAEWLPLLAEIEQYAKAEGCVRVLTECRPGFSRVLPDYKTTAIILEKVL